MVRTTETLTAEGKTTLKKLDTLFKVAPQLATRLLREIDADAEKEVDRLTPRDTASMASTIRKDESKINQGITKIIIGGIMAKFSRAGKPRKFVDYAKYPEEGTIRQPGKHMLVRGVNVSLTKKNSIAKIAFNNWISQFK